MTAKSELILKQMELGPMQNFTYFIGCAKTKEIAVIDPAWEIETLCEDVQKNGYKIKHIFVTHGHYDHTNGVEELLTNCDVPVYISKYEADFFKPRCKNIKKLNDHQRITIGRLEFESLWTPGHAPGCQCLHYDNVLLSGDTLFINGCGRCDIPGGDVNAMYDSLYNKIMQLPDSTIIYPGHRYGPKPFDTLGNQKKTNPFLFCKSREEFVHQRMGI